MKTIKEITQKTRVNKYLYGWKLYVNYGQGWEYEVFEATWKGYLENEKAYRNNCQYPQKWTQGRTINPEWESLERTGENYGKC